MRLRLATANRSPEYKMFGSLSELASYLPVTKLPNIRAIASDVRYSRSSAEIVRNSKPDWEIRGTVRTNSWMGFRLISRDRAGISPFFLFIDHWTEDFILRLTSHPESHLAGAHRNRTCGNAAKSIFFDSSIIPSDRSFLFLCTEHANCALATSRFFARKLHGMILDRCHGQQSLWENFDGSSLHDLRTIYPNLFVYIIYALKKYI